MNRQRAYGIASQWGSYMRAGDPGACFYGFNVGDGRPQDEDHRQDCIAWTKHCIQRVETGMAMGTMAADLDDEDDLGELKALLGWFETCDLNPN